MPRYIRVKSRLKSCAAFTAMIVICSAVSAAYAVTLDKGAPALFHKGGAGDCDGCHGRGTQSSGSYSTSQSFNLLGSDASSTCLRCHLFEGTGQGAEHMVATHGGALGQGQAPGQLTPGGDFGWLKKSYQWSGEGSQTERSPGERGGHNVVAQDFGFAADSKQITAPGGRYPASSLSCISCHAPHGNYRRSHDGTISSSGVPIVASGSYNTSPDPDFTRTVGVYRLLAGKGYQTEGSPGEPFTADPPAAVAPVSYNRDESSADTRVAYGSGVSEWCGNCHGDIHAGTGSGISQHPAGKDARLGAEVTSNYNSYISSGNLNGSTSSAYSSLVPFEMGTEDYGVLKAAASSNGSNTSGPDGKSNVMCLSCHRAHASGWSSMTRWNTQTTFIVYNGNYPGTDNGAPAQFAQGRTSAEAKTAYYGRSPSSFAVFQRSLCNKCHAKD